VTSTGSACGGRFRAKQGFGPALWDDGVTLLDDLWPRDELDDDFAERACEHPIE
jgi:hypothetical protein